MTPQLFAKALEMKSLNGSKVVGLHGRILRGTEEGHFERLSDDPNRLIVFLTDADGLGLLVGKSTYEQLITIGYDKDYIQRLHGKGTYYKLVVFPESESYASDWDGILKLCADVYPDTAQHCQAHSEILRKWPFPHYEIASGIDFKAAENNPQHPEYMSYERFQKSAKSHIDLRGLLYHCFHARELFRGDGYTYNNQGVRGVREYLLPNRRIADIKGSLVIELGKAL